MRFFTRSAVTLALLLAWSVSASAQADQLEWRKEDGRWVGRMVWKTEAGNGGSVDVRSMIGRVEYKGGEAKKATFEIEFYADHSNNREEAMELAEEFFPSLRESGDDVTIRFPKRNSWRRGWNDDDNFSFGIVANLPKEFDVRSGSAAGSATARNLKGNVDMSTGGGSMEVQSCEGDVDLSTGGGSISVEGVTGSLMVNTGGGGIDVYDCTCERRARLNTGGGGISIEASSGDFTVNTGAGGIDIRDHKGMMKVSTGAGSVDIRKIEGEVYASTGTGSIDVELSRDARKAGEIELKTGMGSIDVVLPKDLGANLYAEAHGSRSNRTIRSDYDLDIEVDKYHGTTASGKINGGGVPVRLETGSGKITIRKR